MDAMNFPRVVLFFTAFALTVSSGHALEWVEYDRTTPDNAVSLNAGQEDAVVCRKGSYVGLLTKDTCYSVRQRRPFGPKTFTMDASFEVLTETEVDVWDGTYSPVCNKSGEECHSGKVETYLWPDQQKFGPRVDEAPHYAFIGEKQYAFYLESSKLFENSWWYWYLKIYEHGGNGNNDMIYQKTFKQSGLEEGKEYSLQIEIKSDDDYLIQVRYLKFDDGIGELVVETENIKLGR